jgi:hypothetical protein
MGQKANKSRSKGLGKVLKFILPEKSANKERRKGKMFYSHHRKPESLIESQEPKVSALWKSIAWSRALCIEKQFSFDALVIGEQTSFAENQLFVLRLILKRTFLIEHTKSF